MSTEYFIAKKLIFDKESKKNISYIISKIATISIAVSICIMIISMAVLTGFKNEIRNKIIGFGSHVQILNFDANISYEAKPVSKAQDFYPGLEKKNGIKHIQVFGIKAGIMKTRDEIQGIVLKGVDHDFDWSFFQSSLVKGSTLSINDSAKSNNAIISQHVANKLKLDTGDAFIVHFPQEEPAQFRKFNITGIYNTGLQEFDKIFVVVDIKHIQKLNKWSEDQVSGFEVLIDDFNELDKMTQVVFEEVGLDFMEDGTKLRVENIKEKYPHFFAWIKLPDTNAQVLLTIIIIISILNMTTSLLIMILERTRMIGILKSFGSDNQQIRRIFLIKAAYMIIKGMLWGNAIGIALCLLQLHFKVIKLDVSSYWLSSVPIDLSVVHVIAINLGSLLIILLALLVPSVIISNVSPVKSIRFN